LIPRSGSGLAAHGMAAWREGSDGLYRDHQLPANMSRRQLVRRVKQRGAPNGCTRTPRESLGLDHYEGRSFRGWNPPCVHGAGLLRVYRRRALQGFSPSAEKLPTRKRRIVTTVRTATARSGTSGIPSSLCAWPSRASWPHGYPDAPCVTDRDRWDRLVHMPVNTDGRLLFESVSGILVVHADSAAKSLASRSSRSSARRAPVCLRWPCDSPRSPSWLCTETSWCLKTSG